MRAQAIMSNAMVYAAFETVCAAFEVLHSDARLRFLQA